MGATKKGEPIDIAGMRKRIEGTDDEEIAPAEGLSPRTVTIRISYTDPTGHKHTSEVKTSILGGDDRFNVGKMAAALLDGVRWESIPPAVRSSAHMTAWLAFSLHEPPEWLTKWMQVDPGLLGTIYGEVQAHEVRYFRGNVKEGQQVQERISVSCVELDP